MEWGLPMEITQRLDELGKPAWIALLVLSFILFWPAGLALLAFLIWSGRMGCGRHARDWHEARHRWKEHMRAKAESWHRGYRSSGNRAFDEYREEALRKLEDEQREFLEFLDRLRHAKDKAEFDEFMAQRLNRPPSGPTGAPSGGSGPEPQPYS